jgi:hypothetical protein
VSATCRNMCHHTPDDRNLSIATPTTAQRPHLL